MEENRKTSGLLWRIAFFLFLHTLLSFAASLASSSGLALLQFALHLLSYFLPAALALREGQRRDLLPLEQSGNLRDALPLFPVLLAAMILLSSLTALLIGLWGGEATGGGSERDFLSALGYDCVMPAVLEESLFRISLLPLLVKADRKNAVWINALLFALIHPSVYQIPYAFCGGIILALAAHIGGPLAPILLHFGNNLVSVLLADGEAWWGLPFSIIALTLIAALALASFIWFVRHRREKRYAPIAAFFAHRSEGGRAFFGALLSPIGLWCILAFSLTLLSTLL